MKRAIAAILAVLMLMQLLPATGETYSEWYQVYFDETETPAYHTVRFCAGGEEISAVFVADGGTVESLPEAPRVAGKVFLGWYDGDSLFTTETIVREDREIEAKYEEAQAAADYVFPGPTVYLKDIAAALGISIANNSTLSVDNPSIRLSATRVSNKNKNTITLTANGYFDQATLTIRKNKNSVQTITLAYPEPEEEEEEITLVEGALYYNEHLYLTGKIPGNGIIDVTPVTVSIDGGEVLAAYDIKIYANKNQQRKGKTWQPAGEKVQVHFFDEAFAGKLDVYHIDGAAPEYVDTVTAEDGWVAFEAASFSTYAVTKAIEKTVEIGGNTYHIVVTYSRDAGIPDGAELAVKEVSADAYLAQAADALGMGAGDEFHYARFLDISIVFEGAAIEPKAPVDVTVSLLDVTDGAQALEVVHFADGTQASRVESSADENGNVTFTTDSFSVFGFGSILRSLLSWTSEAVSYTLQGFTTLLRPTYTAISVAVEEGLEMINAYNVESTLGSLLNALYVKVSTALSLGDRESVIVYAVRDGEIADVLIEGGNMDESIALGDADGFAVVKDTGFRRRVFDLGAVELNGMMPKAAEAAANAAEPELDGTLLAAYDISITEENGNAYQPDDEHPVDVSIAVDDTLGDLHVFHIRDDGTQEEITDFILTDGKVSFTANGFSIYAIVNKDDPDSIARAKIVFQNADGTPYNFLNNAGNTVDNQIIRTNSVLEEVGVPAMDVGGQTFQGWYLYDTANNAYTSYQLKFGGSNKWTIEYGDTKSITSSRAVVTSENAEDEGCVFYARPYFGEVNYLTFYNESAGDNTSLGGHGIILNRIQVIEGTEYDISEQQATPPDSVWNEETQDWEPVSYVFMGWSHEAGTDDDNRTPIADTTIDVSENQTFYPIFKQGHWVTFDTAPTGSGATYIPAKIVLSTQTSSVARPTVTPTWKGHRFVGWFTYPETYDPGNPNYYNADGTINTQYNGFLSTNESANGAYRFNERLDEDLTLYAHWNADTANVTVVKWEQVVTDDKNAVTPTAEQMAAEDYASNTGLKHYEYAGQQNLSETVNSILRNNDGDITIPEGFTLDSTLSDAQVVVKDDGTAVLNLYFDRKPITMNFNHDVEVHAKTDATTGTLYGYVDGQYVRITWNGTNWVYTTEEQVTEYVDYTGTRYNTTTGDDGTQYGVYQGEVVRVYHHYSAGVFGIGGYDHWSRKQNHSGNNDQRYNETRYVRNNNGSYGFVNGEMVPLTNGQYQTTTTQQVEHIYNGDRFTQNTTRSFTGLYGQTLAQNGYSWPEGTWQYTDPTNNRDYGMSYLGQFVLPYDGGYTTIDFTDTNNSTKEVRFYLQNVDGSTYPDNYTDIGYLPNTDGTFYFSEKYDGFTVKQYKLNNGEWQTAAVDASVSQPANSTLHIRYERLRYTVKFLDSRDGSELPDAPSQQVVYGASLSTVKPGDDTEITNANTQYVWDGKWYADQACTTEFDFSQTMPNHDVAVYAGWKEVWYWVKIDPNGGELPSTEATWFWEPYGGLAEEYHNITRGYVEDEAGEYYYHMDVLDPETELNQYGTNERKAEYRRISDNPNWQQDSIDGKRYSVDPSNTYSLVGWYKVNDDGTLEPYNFSSPITENLTLRALWRIVGEYHVKYSVEGVDAQGNPLYAEDADGNPTENRLVGSNAPSDTNKYADKSSSSILGPVNPPQGYTFVGWYYNGHVYNPGDTFIVDADLADDNKDIWIYPVYLSIEDQPVETTHIPFVGNGGTTTKTSGSDESWTWEVTDGNTRINYKDMQPNVNFPLAESPTFFTRPGYEFVGWGKRAEGQDTTANNFLEYRDGKFYQVGKDSEITYIAADEFKPYEELYARWEPKKYSVTVVKEVSSPVTGDDEIPFAFSPSFPASISGTEYQTNFALVGKEGGASVTGTDEGGNEITVTYAHTKTYENIPYGTVFSITEGTNSLFDVEVAYTVTDADEAAKNVTDQASSNGEELTVDGNVTVTFTNTRKLTHISLTKRVTGNMAQTSKEFAFTVTAKNEAGQDAGFTVDDTAYTGTASIPLKHGDTVNLSVPVGANITITEVPDGYTLTSAAGATGGTLSGTAYSLTVTEANEDETITFTNDLSQTVDTGVRMSAAPWGMLLLGLLGLALMLYGRRRRGGACR